MNRRQKNLSNCPKLLDHYKPTSGFDSKEGSDYSEEAAFYAEKFDFDLSTWQQLAIAWETDPRRQEEATKFTDWGPSLPTHSEINQRLEKGAQIRQVSVEDYRQQALRSFLNDCRRAHYYGQRNS